MLWSSFLTFFLTTSIDKKLFKKFATHGFWSMYKISSLVTCKAIEILKKCRFKLICLCLKANLNHFFYEEYFIATLKKNNMDLFVFFFLQGNKTDFKGTTWDFQVFSINEYRYLFQEFIIRNEFQVHLICKSQSRFFLKRDLIILTFVSDKIKQ